MKRTQQFMASEIKVAMYDVADQKLVALFSSTYICAKYCFKNNNRAISNYITNKTKNKTNVFERIICFRIASAEHRELLGNEQYQILDDRFNRPGIKNLHSSFNSMPVKKFNDTLK